MSDAIPWLARLSRLRVDRARGHPAPHKPLLLLSILSRMDEGELLPPVLPLTPELAFRFLTLGTVVADRQSQRLDIRLPFHHLQSNGVWTSLDQDGQPSTEFKRTAAVCIDPGFAAFVSDQHNRLNARLVLIRDYFLPPEQAALRELLNMPADEVVPTDPNGSPLVIEEAARQGREARFRLRIVAAYNYTCALTGYRLNTVTGATVVDAAHIHQFSDSRNNDPQNGLALSKTAHWLFDQGLWSLTDDCRVIVACDHFDESGPSEFLLGGYADRPIIMPRDPATSPNPEYIRWHRENLFEGN
jgi:putative restriction endonuclease